MTQSSKASRERQKRSAERRGYQRGLAERDERVRSLEAALRANVEFIKANGWTVPPDIEALAAARKETP